MRPLGIVVALLALAAAGVAPPAWAQIFPPLTGRVVDSANVIPPAERVELDGILSSSEAKTGHQMVVATVPSLGGQAIEDYGVALGRAWGIGRKGENDGVILLVAPTEREVRIEVGYGLEGELTDAIAALIVRGSVLPRFKAGDLAGGIRQGVEDIVAVLEGDAGAFAGRAQARVTREDSAGSAFAVFAFMAVMFVILQITGGGRRRRYSGGVPPIIFGGGGFGGGGSGGGWSGGGGSFGGGGASGRW